MSTSLLRFRFPLYRCGGRTLALFWCFDERIVCNIIIFGAAGLLVVILNNIILFVDLDIPE